MLLSLMYKLDYFIIDGSKLDTFMIDDRKPII